jgi:hypothetical protein
MARMPNPRAARTLRGYGVKHEAERRKWKRRVERGEVFCARCGHMIQPGSPSRSWHLDHTEDRGAYLGPSHARCNTSAGAKKGNRIRGRRLAARQPQPLKSRVW